MERLPEDCMGHILSFSTPLEACRICSVSRATRNIMDSDTFWEKFLPYDYIDIISRLRYPVIFSSKKELFFKLCIPHLIDKGMKMFWLDNKTGKKCYALGARELYIAGSNNPRSWSWKPLTGSRFAEVAELRSTWQLEIHGSIKCSTLSPNTIYLVYLVVQITDRAYGLHKLPSIMTVEIGKHKVQTSMYLSKYNLEKRNFPSVEHACQQNRTQFYRFKENEGQGYNQIPTRENGMIAIELGKFYNHGGDGHKEEEVKMSFKEVKGVHPKGGLVVEGMEIIAQIL